MLGTALLTSVILVLSFKKLLPNILEDVAVSAGEQITTLIKNELTGPQISKAMSVLGKKSGEVRANNALRSKAANKLLEGIPSINFILDQLNITPVEGLQLMNDPLIGPFIRGALQKGIAGLGAAAPNTHTRNDKNIFSVS